MTAVTYRCSSCLDHAVSREYEVSHLSKACPSCGEFARFVHGGVLAQFREFEEAPPDGIDWNRLDRLEKLVVAEGIVRRGRTLESYDVEPSEADSGD